MEKNDKILLGLGAIGLFLYLQSQKAEALPTEEVSIPITPTPTLPSPSLLSVPTTPNLSTLASMETTQINTLPYVPVDIAPASQTVTTTQIPKIYADFSIPLYGLVDRKPIYDKLEELALMGGLLKDIERGFRHAVKEVEQHVIRPIVGVVEKIPIVGPVIKEAERAVERVKAEVKRTWKKITRYINPFQLIIKIAQIGMYLAGVVFPPMWVAALSVDTVVTCHNIRKSKEIKNQIQYSTDVQNQIIKILSFPDQSALISPLPGPILGYIATTRINPALIPLFEIYSIDFKNTTFVTPNLLPIFVTMKYEIKEVKGYISSIPFDSSTGSLWLMYSIEMGDFMVSMAGTPYYNALVNLGYIPIKDMGYIARSPVIGFETEEV